ncbi:hypothetical protein LF1_28590 [Rubripirellula obstinata]|uniref:Uncharacterized protein n=1 Tax=Rubripirellula obstinata TaxID=406547 RepID=A0A5B1CLB1_9BACT|nr:hypothetical protein LF1_28590 [Rubripirellula obstinata]
MVRCMRARKRHDYRAPSFCPLIVLPKNPLIRPRTAPRPRTGTGHEGAKARTRTGRTRTGTGHERGARTGTGHERELQAELIANAIADCPRFAGVSEAC